MTGVILGEDKIRVFIEILKKRKKIIVILLLFLRCNSLTVHLVLPPLKAKRKLDLEDPVYMPEFRTPKGKCSVAARIPSPKSECE